MHRGISLHMTSCSKGLLEDVVSSLWELESARQRQERLVLGVLQKDHETLKWQQKHLQVSPGGVMVVLQQQLSELTMSSKTKDSVDNVSGFYEQSESQSTLRHSRSSPSLSFYSHRGRSVDTYMVDWEGQRARPSRAFLPRSLSAPFPHLEGIAEGVEDDEDDDNGTLLSEDGAPNGENINGPDMDPVVNLNEDGGHIGVLCDYQGHTEEVDEGPMTEDIQQAMRVETYILGLLQRYCLSPMPTSAEVLSSTPDCWHGLLTYPSDSCKQLETSEWQEWKVFNDEKASQDMYDLRDKADRFSQAYEDAGSSTESSTMIADIDSHCLHHPCVSPNLSKSDSPKQNWEPTYVKLAHQVPLARLYQGENWPSVGQRHVTTTSQSQSESSFQCQGFTMKSEHGYHTLGQDMDLHCFDKDYLSSQRLWSSTADLSQEEKVTLLRADERLLRETHLPFHVSPHSCTKYSEQDHYNRIEMNSRGAQEDGSESSLSETCSPRSSSSSSESDESGGLVWPQEVPPCVPSFSQNAPTAMVRIKASHALKKKILRFRSGSLKVMTTV